MVGPLSAAHCRGTWRNIAVKLANILSCKADDESMDSFAARGRHVGLQPVATQSHVCTIERSSNREEIDTWTASLLDVDVSTASRIVAERLKSDNPILLPL